MTVTTASRNLQVYGWDIINNKPQHWQLDPRCAVPAVAGSLKPHLHNSDVGTRMCGEFMSGRFPLIRSYKFCAGYKTQCVKDCIQ